MLGKLVAMVLSFSSSRLCTGLSFGTAAHIFEAPKGRSSTFTAGLLASALKSMPVMPASMMPRPTYMGISLGRKKKNSIPFLVSSWVKVL